MINRKCIYFLIVNYNGCEETIKLLKNIYSIRSLSFLVKVVVVDNNSEYSDVVNIKNFLSNHNGITLLELDSNIGYFPAFNVAISYIEKSLPTSVVLCNNDILFESTFLELYFATDYYNDVFVVSPNVITADGVHQNPHVVSRVSNIRKILYKVYFYNYYIAILFKTISRLLSTIRCRHRKIASHDSQYIHMGIGACYILRPIFFQYIQKLDARVFLGGEEALLSGQLNKTGGKIYYDSKLIVHHADGISFSKMPTRWRYEASKQSFKIYKDYL